VSAHPASRTLYHVYVYCTCTHRCTQIYVYLYIYIFLISLAQTFRDMAQIMPDIYQVEKMSVLTMNRNTSNPFSFDRCALSSLHPPFSAVEDHASDWGLLPLSPASQLAHYASWVPGVQCLPFVPCAWDRCYPGGGNYDGAVSDTSTITTLPGFAVSQDTVNLKQGETVTINITLDVPTPDSGIVNVSLSLVGIDGVTEQEFPVASLSPSRLTFGQGLPTWVVVSLRWERLGRAGQFSI